MIEFRYPADFDSDLLDKTSDMYQEVTEAIIKEVSKLLTLLATIVPLAVQSSARIFSPPAKEVGAR